MHLPLFGWPCSSVLAWQAEARWLCLGGLQARSERGGLLSFKWKQNGRSANNFVRFSCLSIYEWLMLLIRAHTPKSGKTEHKPADSSCQSRANPSGPLPPGQQPKCVARRRRVVTLGGARCHRRLKRETCPVIFYR